MADPRDRHEPGSYYARLMGSGSDLEVRCAAAVREQALLIDGDRLVELSARFVALRAAALGALSEELFAEGIATAIRYALDVDRDLAVSGRNGPSEHYVFLEREYYVEPERTAKAATAFNSLPFETRRDTMNLLVHGYPVAKCMRLVGETDRDRLVDRARTGLLAIFGLDPSVLAKKPRKQRGKGSR